MESLQGMPAKGALVVPSLGVAMWYCSSTTTEKMTLPKTNIAIENPPFWWYLQGNMGVFMGYVSFREGNSQNAASWILPKSFPTHIFLPQKHKAPFAIFHVVVFHTSENGLQQNCSTGCPPRDPKRCCIWVEAPLQQNLQRSDSSLEFTKNVRYHQLRISRCINIYIYTSMLCIFIYINIYIWKT